MPAPRKYQNPGQESQPLIKPAPLPKAGGSRSLVLRDQPLLPGPGKTESVGTTQRTPRNIREGLKDKWGNITGRTLDWVSEGDRLETLLAKTKLRDIGVFLGIATEKVLLLEGQPTAIIGQAEHKKMDELLPALMQEMQRRGMKAELTERKAVVTIAPK